MAFAFGGCIWGHALEFETMGRICSSVLFLKWMDKERGKERSVVGVLPELLLVLADCRERDAHASAFLSQLFFVVKSQYLYWFLYLNFPEQNKTLLLFGLVYQ